MDDTNSRNTPSLRLFFSVGDPSGDVHGANLIRELRAIEANIECVGLAGPEMEAAGCKLHADLTAFAIMWFLRVIANIPKMHGLVRRAGKYFDEQRPDAVVLIDFPGFNWWIAAEAKRRGIPVFYYCPPQIWAWASWRIRKMRRYIDHVLCSLPFEEDWFRERGCNTTFVGHPFFDEAKMQDVDRDFLAAEQSRDERLVLILPGSRTQEVNSNTEYFIRAADRVRRDAPNVRFAVAAFKESHAKLVEKKIDDAVRSGMAPLPIEVHVKRTPELIRAAHCCMGVSGSVSLELLAHLKPTVILYKISRFAFWVQARFRRVKYITLVNLLSTGELYPEDITLYDPNQADADRVLFPEYLTWEDASPKLAGHLVEWLEDEAAYEKRVSQLEALRSAVGHGGASKSAAAYIVEHAYRPTMRKASA